MTLLLQHSGKLSALLDCACSDLYSSSHQDCINVSELEAGMAEVDQFKESGLALKEIKNPDSVRRSPAHVGSGGWSQPGQP